MTEQEAWLEYYRELSKTEQQEARCYYAWVDLTGKSARSLSISVPWSLLGFLFGLNAMGTGFAMLSSLFLLAPVCWAVHFRVKCCVWPWNPIRRSEKTSTK